jgi:ubiquitin C
MTSLKVKPSDTFESIKLKIHERQGIPLSQLRLMVSQKGLEDDRTLADYNIQNESTILMTIVELPRSNTKSGKDAFTFEVYPSDTIESVKLKIHDKAGIPLLRYLELVFGSKWLKDDRTLADYNLQNGSALVLRTESLSLEDYDIQKESTSARSS